MCFSTRYIIPQSPAKSNKKNRQKGVMQWRSGVFSRRSGRSWRQSPWSGSWQPSGWGSCCHFCWAIWRRGWRSRWSAAYPPMGVCPAGPAAGCASVVSCLFSACCCMGWAGCCFPKPPLSPGRRHSYCGRWRGQRSSCAPGLSSWRAVHRTGWVRRCRAGSRGCSPAAVFWQKRVRRPF